MNRDELVRDFEKETGLKFNVEFVAYNDYSVWLELKLLAIPDVIGRFYYEKR
jgi:ABC-type glycerol-3-phosphate transport system substrate-binding protein